MKYFLLDHKCISIGVHHGYMLLFCILSALFFSVGFNTFINISTDIVVAEQKIVYHLATGGASGISQCLIMVVELIDPSLNLPYQLLQSIFYFILNIPLLIFSFIKLGWKFSVYTTLNVILVTLFLNVLPPELFKGISEYVASSLLTRVIFGGICTGLAISLAFKGGFSAGFVDIIGYYLSVKKSNGAGKYIALINIAVVIVFSGLTLASSPDIKNSIAEVVIVACFSIVYQFVGSIVTDKIDVRNKKVLLQIITSNKTLSRIIIANVPHSCTIVDGKGGYTGSPKQIIYSVVSNTEVAKLVKEIRAVDDTSFINTMHLNQVYGKFYIKREK